MKGALKEDLLMSLKMDLNLGKPGVLFCSGKQTRDLTPGHFIHLSCVLQDCKTCEGIHLQNVSNENNWGGNCQQLDVVWTGLNVRGTHCRAEQSGLLSTVLAGGVLFSNRSKP